MEAPASLSDFPAGFICGSLMNAFTCVSFPPFLTVTSTIYPVETLLDIGAAGIAGGAVTAVRAIGGAFLKQPLPERPIATARITRTRPSPPSGAIDAAIRTARESNNPGTQLEGQVAQRIKDAGSMSPASRAPDPSLDFGGPVSLPNHPCSWRH
jgi:hypothetical protein